ncbi:hypothetical protein XG19_004664 [Salmonella enterica subsp. enterica serovar Gaminara]|nr:hypothetical protein [Salmonella enterica subsp. enterica serovar Gaminara]ECO0313592.1 hypothetical protein [Salmonella enterica subsp. enterica serovar Schwarzengrund]EDP8790004.1 hypothetical protein [Salmonella enterica subsp. enterica]ECY4705431.1 hypothetical protein [Salmonella enterica subsp. enterica serovar Gaminara]ECY5825958.1 hypothetical protein [Salmonella enterica subsp. enterica serovar Schwarzengrund]
MSSRIFNKQKINIIFLFSAIFLLQKQAHGIEIRSYYSTSLGAQKILNDTIKKPDGNEFSVSIVPAQSSGKVKCVGAEVGGGFTYNWGDEPYQPWNFVTSNLPPSSYGNDWFRLNENIDVSIKPRFGMNRWFQNGGQAGAVCAYRSSINGSIFPPTETVDPSRIGNPSIDVVFRVKKLPADGIIRLPRGKIASVSVAYSGNYKPTSMTPPEAFAIVVDDFSVVFDAVCKWDNAAPLVFDYGIIPTSEGDKVMSLHPGLVCSQDGLVKLRLDTTWGSVTPDGIQVDLKDHNFNVTGHSYMKFNGGGREILTPVRAGIRQNFSIENTLDTTGMPAGPFEGSAVLIATFE